MNINLIYTESFDSIYRKIISRVLTEVTKSYYDIFAGVEKDGVIKMLMEKQYFIETKRQHLYIINRKYLFSRTLYLSCKTFPIFYSLANIHFYCNLLIWSLKDEETILSKISITTNNLSKKPSIKIRYLHVSSDNAWYYSVPCSSDFLRYLSKYWVHRQFHCSSYPDCGTYCRSIGTLGAKNQSLGGPIFHNLPR